MFLDYSELLNALDSGASAKITIYNRRINKAEFERSVLLPDKDDGLDEYRHEFNQMLTAQVTGTSNSIVRERYLTVSVVKRNADEARSYFARVGTDLVTHLAQLSSVATELTLNERLHIFRDFFKAGEQAAAEFNIHEHAKRGQHFKDWFCPDSMEFAADHFKLDARYGRVLYLQDYASYIKDSFVSELCDLDRDLMLSIDILPVPTDEAARQLQSTLLGRGNERCQLAAPPERQQQFYRDNSLRHGVAAQGNQGDAGRPDHPRPADDVRAGDAGASGRQQRAA